VKNDFACFGPVLPKVGTNFSKDFAFFHQPGDDFAQPGSPKPPAPHGSADLKARFSRRLCGFLVRHFAATLRARQTAK
jgi:hypothetical protein